MKDMNDTNHHMNPYRDSDLAGLDMTAPLPETVTLEACPSMNLSIYFEQRLLALQWEQEKRYGLDIFDARARAYIKLNQELKCLPDVAREAVMRTLENLE